MAAPSGSLGVGGGRVTQRKIHCLTKTVSALKLYSALLQLASRENNLHTVSFVNKVPSGEALMPPQYRPVSSYYTQGLQVNVISPGSLVVGF